MPLIHLKSKKDSSLLSWTVRRLLPPLKVRIPYGDFSGPPAVPCVEIGTRVRIGEKIALPSEDGSLAVHSSVSGKVTEIGLFPHPFRGTARAVEITSDQQDLKLPEIGTERSAWEKLREDEYLTLFRESGLRDLNSASEPLHVKILNSVGIRTLIINACESDPYETSAHALMMSHPLEILKGAEIIRRAAGAGRVIVATQSDKIEAAEILKSKIYFLKWKNFEVQILPSIFPQDEPVLLIERFKASTPSPLSSPSSVSVYRHLEECFLRREIPLPRDFSPSARNDDSTKHLSPCRGRGKGEGAEDTPAVFELASAFAVYEAVVLQKPFYERVVTVSGECVVEPQNVWAKMGSDFEFLIKGARGFLRPAGRIVAGGAMRGIAQEHLAVPVTGGVSSVLALAPELTKPASPEPCIRCGECVAHCPADISPAMITLAAELDLFETARDYGVEHCIGCGNCAYVCPSKRPMLELLRYAGRHQEQNQEFSPLEAAAVNLVNY